MFEARNTEIKRAEIQASTRERVWGRSAARCVLCADPLLNQDHFWHEVPTGEIAHAVGATSGRNSPRGDSALSSKERAQENNLLLLCHSCHRVIDSRQLRDKYSIEYLLTKKAEHEKRVREVTNFPTLRPATVLRLFGRVRGILSPPTFEQVSDALLSQGLTGFHVNSHTGMIDGSIDFDEHHDWSWQAAKTIIEESVDRAYQEVESQSVSVLAVFPLAPIPMLIYLGSCLDDNLEVRLFQRRRSDSSSAWAWPTDFNSATRFSIMHEDNKTTDEDDICVIISLSGTINRARLPVALMGMPLISVVPEGAEPGPDIIDSQITLEAFSAAWRGALASIEWRWPNAKRLHIIAATPATAAVSLGRYRMRSVHPTFVLYQRTGGDTYERVMEIADDSQE